MPERLAHCTRHNVSLVTCCVCPVAEDVCRTSNEMLDVQWNKRTKSHAWAQVGTCKRVDLLPPCQHLRSPCCKGEGSRLWHWSSQWLRRRFRDCRLGQKLRFRRCRFRDSRRRRGKRWKRRRQRGRGRRAWLSDRQVDYRGCRGRGRFPDSRGRRGKRDGRGRPAGRTGGCAPLRRVCIDFWDAAEECGKAKHTLGGDVVNVLSADVDCDVGAVTL